MNAVTHFHAGWVSDGMTYRLVQDEGTGQVSQGEASWSGYTVSTEVLTHMARRIGLLACVRGLRRHVALLLDEDRRVRLVEQRDDARRILAESEAIWDFEERLPLTVTVAEGRITARAAGVTLTAAGDSLPTRGAIGLLVETGHAEFAAVRIRGV